MIHSVRCFKSCYVGFPAFYLPSLCAFICRKFQLCTMICTLFFFFIGGKASTFTTLADGWNKLPFLCRKAKQCHAACVFIKTEFPQCQSTHAELNDSIYSPTESGLESYFHQDCDQHILLVTAGPVSETELCLALHGSSL